MPKRKEKIQQPRLPGRNPRIPILQLNTFWVIASFLFFYFFFLRVTGNEWVLSPPYQDIYRISYPFLLFIDRCVDNGFLPLWNPYQFAGHPFAANGEAGVFYLPKLLVCLLTDGTSLLGWHALFHAWIGWIAMFSLLREFRRSTAGCVLGATAWVFSGLGITLLPWIAFTASTIVWYPLAILVVKKSAELRPTIAIPLLAACVALQILAGMAAYIVPFMIMLGAYALYSIFSTSDRIVQRRIALTTAAGIVLGIAVAGIHLIPTIEMMAQSQRLALAEQKTGTIAFDLGKWWNDFQPGAVFGQLFFPAGDADNTQREMPFIMLPVWFAGIIGLFAALRRKSSLDGEHRFWAWTALVGFLMLFNTPLWAFLVSAVPALVDFHLITKGNMFYTLAMIILATHLLESDELRRWKIPSLLILIGGGVIAYAAFTGTSGPKFSDELKSQHLYLFLGTAGAFAVLWWLHLRDKLRRTLFIALTTVTITVSGGIATWWYLYTNNFSMPVREYYQPNQLTEFLTREGKNELFRVLPIGVNMYPNTETVYQLYGVNGYSPAHWWRYTQVMQIADADGDPYLRPGFSQHVALNSPQPGVLALLNTKYVVTPEGIMVVPGYFPRAWLSNAYTIVPDTAERLARIKNGQFERGTVMLETDPNLQTWLGADTAGAIRFISYNPNSIEIDVEAASNRLLTLSEVNFPGWRATVNGQEIPIFTSYHILRTIAVPAGRHTVRFEYFPPSAQLGLAFSGAGLLANLVLLGLAFGQRPKS